MREALAAIAVVSDRLRRGEMGTTAVGTTLANTTS
jgi:hypothetical protein